MINFHCSRFFRRGTAVIAALTMIFSTSALTASATLEGQVTTAATEPIVTEIPNEQIQQPQETQTPQYNEAQNQTSDNNSNQPYNTNNSDNNNGLTAQGLLDSLNINESSNTIDLIILITILSLAPSILVMMTCFTRIIISFSLLRNALGVQQTPPNQVMIGLALFLTLFIMTPVINQMNEVAYVPYKNGEMTSVEAVKAASVPLKNWMLKNTSNESMNFFLELSGDQASVETEEDFAQQVSFTTVVPAFILSEIKIGFEIGFLLYIPFLIIDIVVSTVLMSMGMMMLPPTTISVPFKILLFVLADGWTMLAGSLVNGFNS